jgi:5'(3')-deoxyribonucleotidase
MPKILYVDMDNVLVDFRTGIARLDESLVREYAEHLDDVPGIFALMEPMKDAVESFKTLAQRFDTYILSTSPWENPSAWSDKLEWIKKHLGTSAYKRLILTHHKNLNIGDYLIDDRTKNGTDQFKARHIHFGSEKFPNWRTVTSYLLAQIR